MILSVSRRTDIPCCHSEWFLARVRAGYALVRNPVAPSQVSRVPITPELVDCIVFWTKDPAPLLPFLPELDHWGYRYYFQFTLTPYGRDLEPGLRDKPALEETFRALSRAIGRERVVWRYDPIVLTESTPPAWHRAQFARMCEVLSPFTEAVTISFLDLYPRLKRQGLSAPSLEVVEELAGFFGETARSHGLMIRACAEPYDLSPFGVSPASCIDRALIEHICGGRIRLGGAQSQRPACGCCESVDIGAYDTCRNGCIYCYADHGRHTRPDCDPHSPLLAGSLQPGDKVHERAYASALDYQSSLFESQ